MTNFERWGLYTSGLASPQNYIDWGFVYLITASLQRRVWMPPAHRKLYPNIYPILVGNPGIGKGMLIRYVSEILKHHKLANMQFNKPRDEKEAEMISMLQTTIQNEEKENGQTDLIPMLPDAITYEALVQNMARSIGRINYHEFDPKQNKERMRVYTHSSLAACIEELASLFRKNTESLVTFLIQAYDCADEYKYETKSQGKDRITNVCLNFLGGTNPGFIREIFDEGLVSSGFSSRIFFIHAHKNRKSVCFLPELTAEQEEHKKHLIAHVGELTKLHGQCKIAPEVFEWMETWWAKMESDPSMRVSKSPKLDGYYSRRNIHTMKIAMALHFAETTDLTVPLERFIEADEFLRKEEKTMHLALMVDGDTPEAKASAKIMAFLRANGRQTFVSLLGEFWEQGVRKDMLTEILQTLDTIGAIKLCQEKDEVGMITMYYEAKK